MRLHRRNRVMLVTGATGFVGRHLVNGAATERWEIVAPGSATLDVRRRDRTIEAIRDWKPNAVIHLAYRKDDAATIVDGSRHVAEGAAAVGARLVHLSTDVVFGGRPRPYTEDDPTSPITTYGEHKATAERAVAQIAPGAVIVRTSLVYGTTVPSPAQVELAAALRSPAARRHLSYFTDEFRCPVHADDLAAALAELAGRPEIAGPLHVTGPERVSRARLAALMAANLGAPGFAVPTSTIAESGTVRPGDVTLDVARAASLGITCRPVSTVLA